MSFTIRHQLALRSLNTFGIAATARVAYTLTDEAGMDGVLEAFERDAQAQKNRAGPGHAGMDRARTDHAREDPAGKAHVSAPSSADRPFILSGGSNLLLARDLTEPLLLMRTRGRQIVDEQGDAVWLDVAAGEVWHDIVRWTLQQGCFGLENLALIPGRAGAAPWQNIGAYGVEVGELIDSVAAIHLKTGERRRFTAAACAFGYRQSFFKTPAGRDWLILSVRLKLSRTFTPRLGYAELARALGVVPPAGDGSSGSAGAESMMRLTATRVADTVEAIRRRKLPDPAVLGNAGSFFHNPVVDADTLERLRQQYPDAPAHPVLSGTQPHYKLSAGWLIDTCGWKGFREGDAGVSPHHALVLVNYGHATGQELLDLARRIQTSVHERFGVELHPEPVIIQ